MRGYEIWPTFAALIFLSVQALQKNPPVCESRKTAPFPPGVDPVVSAHQPRPRFSLFGAEGGGAQ